MEKHRYVGDNWAITSSTSITNAAVWSQWSVSASSTATTNQTWLNWNKETAQILTQALNRNFKTEYEGTWVRWNVNHARYNETRNGIVTAHLMPMTPQEEARQRAIEQADLAAARERLAQNVRAMEVVAEAKAKAEKLLQSALDNKQKEELRTKGFFHCKSQKGTLYRIYRGSHGNVKKIDNGKEVESLCVQPAYVPEGDCMLAQKLHIEHNEDEFRRTANIRTLMN